MQQILEDSNLELQQQVKRLLIAFENVSSLKELTSYHQHVVEACRDLEEEIEENLRRVSSQPDAAATLFSETRRLSRTLKLYNQRFAGPLLRQIEADRLTLRILNWLHAQHGVTENIPAAVSNEEFSIWPDIENPTVYAMPASVHQGLLYQPLFFHEFGHLLYRCHQPYMEEYVGTLQEQISSHLTPLIQRDDGYAQRQKEKREMIVNTWYTWAEELFCDVVGLTIGGPAYLYAWDRYMRIAERTEYHSENLAYRDHPTSWLRTQLLVRRAKQLGYQKPAVTIEREWNQIATTLQAEEDHYGFYEESFVPILWQTLDKMLQEADPHPFTGSEIEAWSPNKSPAHLLNQAWRIYLSDPASYPAWEKQIVALFCKT